MLSLRCRRFYFLDRELSTGGNPDTTYLTVPNIPLLTGFHKIRGMGLGKGFASNLIIDSGVGGLSGIYVV